MTKAELALLRQISPSGISFAPESTSHTDRHAFRVLVQRVRSLEAQGLIVTDFAVVQHTTGTDPLAVFCSLTELGPLALSYLLAAGGSAYLRKSAVQPYIATGQFHLVPGSPHFSYPVYVVHSANADATLQRALAGLRGTLPV